MVLERMANCAIWTFFFLGRELRVGEGLLLLQQPRLLVLRTRLLSSLSVFPRALDSRSAKMQPHSAVFRGSALQLPLQAILRRPRQIKLTDSLEVQDRLAELLENAVVALIRQARRRLLPGTGLPADSQDCIGLPASNHNIIGLPPGSENSIGLPAGNHDNIGLTTGSRGRAAAGTTRATTAARDATGTPTATAATAAAAVADRQAIPRATAARATAGAPNTAATAVADGRTTPRTTAARATAGTPAPIAAASRGPPAAGGAVVVVVVVAILRVLVVRDVDVISFGALRYGTVRVILLHELAYLRPLRHVFCVKALLYLCYDLRTNLRHAVRRPERDEIFGETVIFAPIERKRVR